MKLSNYFLPTIKENPSEAQITSHRYMLRAGLIRNSATGIYSYLPLGLKVLKKIEDIVRSEQNATGALEINMATIQSADLWKESGRYDDYGKEMLKITDRNEHNLLYGPTNEEVICDLFRRTVKSWKQLPLNLWHIQSKFRDEIRPRFGVLRSREFIMKDAYSFDIDQQSAEISYYKMFVAYLRTFDSLGIRAIPMKADTGPIGGTLSHEFLVLADTGESEVYCHQDFLNLQIPTKVDYHNDNLKEYVQQWTQLYAVTDEMYDHNEALPYKDKIIKTRGIEVGQLFYFADKYSKPMNALITDQNKQNIPVHMGSYGIGISRLIGAIIEANHDEKGIIWPLSVAPFKILIMNLTTKSDESTNYCNKLYDQFSTMNLEPLLDDTNERAGVKFANADLIGIPLQIIVGSKNLHNNQVEVKLRNQEYSIKLSSDNLAQTIHSLFENNALHKLYE